MEKIEMMSKARTGNEEQKPHLVLIPLPAQSHIKTMLKLAKLLNHKNFHITFVNTEYNHKRFLNSRGPDSMNGSCHFEFKTIPDGIPPSDDSDSTQDTVQLCKAILNNMLVPFSELLVKLNSNTGINPPVTCIISDGFMPFTTVAAKEHGIPLVFLYTVSACSLMGISQFRALKERGVTPLKDVSLLKSAYMDQIIDNIPGMDDIRFRDLPSFVRTTDPNDFMYNFCIESVEAACEASAVVVHTLDSLEKRVLDALSSMIPNVCAIGPLQLLLDQVNEEERGLSTIGYNLWKEETGCLKWLDSRQPNSVLYVNFGSIAFLTKDQLTEFAMGLVASRHPFLWIIRPDLVTGENAILPQDMFDEETRANSYIASWCPQEEVLKHKSIKGFLTHCGWNSVLESICCGVPMLCWPFIADQQTNCRFICNEWGIGMEIDGDVSRDVVCNVVRELMDGERGETMKTKVLEWKKLAEEANQINGSSYLNFEKLVNQVILPNKK